MKYNYNMESEQEREERALESLKFAADEFGAMTREHMKKLMCYALLSVATKVAYRTLSSIAARI